MFDREIFITYSACTYDLLSIGGPSTTPKYQRRKMLRLDIICSPKIETWSVHFDKRFDKSRPISIYDYYYYSYTNSQASYASTNRSILFLCKLVHFVFQQMVFPCFVQARFDLKDDKLRESTTFFSRLFHVLIDRKKNEFVCTHLWHRRVALSGQAGNRVFDMPSFA